MKKVRRKRKRPDPNKDGDSHVTSEGAIIIQQNEEASESELLVDTTKLPAPDLTYSANSATVKRVGGDIQYVFGQNIPLTEHASTIVAVSYSIPDFKKTLTRCEDFRESLRKYVDASGHSVAGGIDFASLKEHSPEKVHHERVTFERMSFRATDGEVEFYFISPARFQEFKRDESKERVVEGKLAVTLSSANLLQLLDEAFDLDLG